MPKKVSSKRPVEAVDPKVQIAKKAKIVDPVTDKCDTLASYFRVHATSLPAKCRELLSNLVSGSLGLGAAQDERHEFQVAAVEILEQAVIKMESQLEESIKENQENLDQAESQKASLHDAQTAAEAEFAEKQVVIDAKTQELTSVQQQVAVARAKYAEAHNEQVAASQQTNAYLEDKKTYETAFNDLFIKLKNGTFENSDEAKKNVDLLMPLCRKINVNDSLLVALPTAAAKMPAVRGNFDNMVMTELETQLEAQIAALEVKARGCAPAMAECQAAVEIAQEALDLATKEQEKASNELKASQADKKDFQVVLNEARKAVKMYAVTHKQVEAQRNDLVKALAEFKEGPALTFRTLKDRQSVVPAPPVEAAVLEDPAPEQSMETDGAAVAPPVATTEGVAVEAKAAEASPMDTTGTEEPVAPKPEAPAKDAESVGKEESCPVLELPTPCRTDSANGAEVAAH